MARDERGESATDANTLSFRDGNPSVEVSPGIYGLWSRDHLTFSDREQIWLSYFCIINLMVNKTTLIIRIDDNLLWFTK